ncbi:MAG TPA: class I SAM-dependent methyltransferase [Rubrobacteraceae bacterium]|nr:class I SAM-dependent methyltransferase [Rubrobacteraceae bacterium]
MRDATRHTVEAGYDRMAEAYLATKDPEDPTTISALEDLAGYLPPGASVLDLGCGAGVPATRWLARRGFAVTGVDFSGKQLELARRLVPDAVFIRADMTELDLAPETFDAVVALHSIIHVPRLDHPTLLGSIHRWLRPGGVFLATLTMTDFEGEDPDWEGWGAAMRWSHYDRETNVSLLREAKFEVVYAEPRTGGGTGNTPETWLWVLARKD